MSYADRYRRVAASFSERVDAVDPAAWDNAAPCEGWRARDVVGHLVEWVPPVVLQDPDRPAPTLPSAEDDPAGAWHALDAEIQALLDDPVRSARTVDLPMGTMPLGQAVDMIVTGDVFLHAWDLARATGLDERLDPDEVHAALVGMEPIDQALRDSGHFGPKVDVPDDADEQTRLLAFIGRQP